MRADSIVMGALNGVAFTYGAGFLLFVAWLLARLLLSRVVDRRAAVVPARSLALRRLS